MASFEVTPRREALPSLWRPLGQLNARVDDGIAELYAALGIDGVKPRFSMALMFLEDAPLSIRELARDVGVTHSAMSQTVAAMKQTGLVESTPGTDARSRVVSLTPAGLALVPTLRAEWAATEAALAELETEGSVRLSIVVAELHRLLDERSFADRVRARFDAGSGSAPSSAPTAGTP